MQLLSDFTFKEIFWPGNLRFFSLVLLRIQKKYGIIISKKIREKPDKGEKHDFKSNYTENIR